MKKTFKSIISILLVMLLTFSCCSVALAADDSDKAVLDVVYDEKGNRVGFKTITVGENIYYDIFDGEENIDKKDPLDFYETVITKENSAGDSALELWSKVADKVFRIGGTEYGYNYEFGNYDEWYANDKPNVEDGEDVANADINLQYQLSQTEPYSAGVLEEHCVRATGLQPFYSMDGVQTAMLDQIVDVCGEQNDAEIFKKAVLEHCSIDGKGLELLKDTRSQPILAHIVTNQYNTWTTRRYFSSFGIAFYDFKLTPVIEENLQYISAADNYESVQDAFENSAPGVSYEVDNENSSSVSYIQNPTGSTANVSVSASKSVTNSLSTSFSESESYSFTESSELNLEVTPIKDRFKIGLKLGFSASQAFSTAFSEGTSVSETISTSTAASVTLPPYTEIGVKQTTSTVEQAFTYNCPVYVTYKVAIFGMNAEYMQYSGDGEWGYKGYDQGSICVGFGCEDILGGISATNNLYNRLNLNSSSFEMSYGNVSGMYEIQDDGNDPAQLRYINWNSSKINYDDIKSDSIKLKNNIPMSSVGATMYVKTDTSGTELTHIYPMYDLKRIRFEGTGAYTLGIGGKLDLNTVNVIGLNEFDREYYGFLARMGTWHLCDENGKDLPDYAAGKGITIEPTPTTQTIIANEIGDYYLRFDIDEKFYTKADDRKTYITNDDLEMTAIMKLSVTDTGNNHTCRPGGWITYIPANCVVEGERYKNCLTCSKRMATEVIPKADHIPVEVVTPATCNTDGSKTTTCLTCKTVIFHEVIPAKGHGNTYSVTTVAPTCSSVGEKVIYCYDCNKAVGSEEIECTSHNSGAWNVDFEPVAGRDGQMTRYCINCGTPLESKVIVGNNSGNNSDNNNGNNSDNNTDNVSCSHMCHSTGFMSFFWKIVCTFWKLFKMNPVCECGMAHY